MPPPPVFIPDTIAFTQPKCDHRAICTVYGVVCVAVGSGQHTQCSHMVDQCHDDVAAITIIIFGDGNTNRTWYNLLLTRST